MLSAKQELLVTTTTQSKLLCKCGHAGSLVRVESDYAFRGGWSDEYYLDGFDGERLIVRSDDDMPTDILGALECRCPKCKKRGTVRYA